MPVLIQHEIALLSSNFLTYGVLATNASKKPIDNADARNMESPENGVT